MAIETLDLETAFKLNIKNVYEGNSFSIVFQRFADDGTTPENWPVRTYEFAVSANPSGTPNLFSLTTTGGQIVLSGNLLTITCLKTENLMVGGANTGKTYYYDLVSDLGSGITKVEGNGTILTKYSIAK